MQILLKCLLAVICSICCLTALAQLPKRVLLKNHTDCLMTYTGPEKTRKADIYAYQKNQAGQLSRYSNINPEGYAPVYSGSGANRAPQGFIYLALADGSHLTEVPYTSHFGYVISSKTSAPNCQSDPCYVAFPYDPCPW